MTTKEKIQLSARLFAIASAIESAESKLTHIKCSVYYEVFGTEEERKLDLRKVEIKLERLEDLFEKTLLKIQES